MLKNVVVLIFVSQSLCYIEIPLTVNEHSENLSLSIPAEIKGHHVQLQLTWSYDDEQIRLPLSLSDNQQSGDQNNVPVRFQAESVVRRGLEGFKRNIIQAITFKNKEYFENVELLMHYIPEPGADNVSGTINLSRSPNHNKILSRLLDQFEAGRQIFSIYVSHVGSFLQLGGLDSAYSIGRTQTIKCHQAHNWTFSIKSSSIVQRIDSSEHKSSLGSSMIVMLNFEKSYMGVPEFMVQLIMQRLEQDSITCHAEQQHIECSNITNLKLQTKRFVLQVADDYSIIINLIKLKKDCNWDNNTCTLNIRRNPYDFITIGSFMLRQYYMSFDIDRSEILIAKANHYPQKEDLLVFIIRFMFYFLVFLIGTILLAMLPRLRKVAAFYWNRKNPKPMEMAQEVVATEREVI